MQALTIYLITRYDIAVIIIIFIWFMFFDRHYMNVQGIYISKYVHLERFWLKVKSIRF